MLSMSTALKTLGLMQTVNEFKGWTNYATWRVNLEILGDIEFVEDDNISVETLEKIVESTVFDDLIEKDGLATDYARAFLSEVNYYEILEHIQENFE